jgi:hypothetical protein
VVGLGAAAGGSFAAPLPVRTAVEAVALNILAATIFAWITSCRGPRPEA